MLRLEVKSAEESFDEERQEFIPPAVMVLELEHSLFSVSKWESKWNVPFLTNKPTEEHTLDYIRMMYLGGEFPEKAFSMFTAETYDSIREYVERRMTATIIPEERDSPRPRRPVTAELIYYWMVSHSIPFECQYWHLDRLLTLIQVCNVENRAASGKKNSRRPQATSEALARRNALNEQRRRELGSSG